MVDGICVAEVGRLRVLFMPFNRCFASRCRCPRTLTSRTSIVSSSCFQLVHGPVGMLKMLGECPGGSDITLPWEFAPRSRTAAMLAASERCRGRGRVSSERVEGSLGILGMIPVCECRPSFAQFAVDLRDSLAFCKVHLDLSPFQTRRNRGLCRELSRWVVQ